MSCHKLDEVRLNSGGGGGGGGDIGLGEKDLPIPSFPHTFQGRSRTVEMEGQARSHKDAISLFKEKCKNGPWHVKARTTYNDPEEESNRIGRKGHLAFSPGQIITVTGWSDQETEIEGRPKFGGSLIGQYTDSLGVNHEGILHPTTVVPWHYGPTSRASRLLNMLEASPFVLRLAEEIDSQERSHSQPVLSLKRIWKGGNRLTLERLPGEIRNKIYEFCIINAFQSSVAKRRQGKTKPSMNHFDITVVRRWDKLPVLRLEGAGPLPLIFANKLFYNEVTSLIYCKVRTLKIGGYILRNQYDDPVSSLKAAYTLILKSLTLLRFTKNLTIIFPFTRNDIIDGDRTFYGLPPRRSVTRSQNSNPASWRVDVPMRYPLPLNRDHIHIPRPVLSRDREDQIASDLLEFLLVFQNLKTAEIVNKGNSEGEIRAQLCLPFDVLTKALRDKLQRDGWKFCTDIVVHP
ncbi:hypothetical protein B0O99DRAFT_598099 [Bisporella sp. PMI_857]|nr:hypothetical protein B0O99DRAFT_598099 [Bisporella sp. PMI_857]